MMSSPSFSGPSAQQLEAAQHSELCKRIRTNIVPIPSFALSSERSESSESFKGRTVPRRQDPVPQDSPFGWFGSYLSRFQDSSTVPCRICHPPRRKTWWSVILLDSCARAGCERCVIRLLATLKIIQRDRIGPDMLYSQVQFQGPIITLKFHSGLPELEKRNNRAPFFPWNSRVVKIQLYISPESYALCWHPLIGVGRDVMQDRKTQYSRLVMAWLDSCFTHHPRCGLYIHLLPPRVIDVGASGSPRLQLRNTLGAHAPYVVLSYCFDGWWRAPKTTKDNLIRRELEIPFHEMPSIFRDAIHIVRGLGIRYLWIDSLCIIQDDESDMLANVSSIASIYRNAFFVLGAYRPLCPQNNSSEVGLFSTLHDNLRGEPFAHVENLDGSVSQVRARLFRKPHGLFCGVSRPVGYGVRSRAWAMQEQLFASRMVHFTERELIWECRRLVGCECMELDCSSGIKVALHKKAWFNKLLEQPMGDDFYKFWWYMLSRYSGRTFARGWDVLLAISALARQMQQHGAGEYLAGMWKNDLPQSLLWDRRTPIFQAPSKYIAPSWSWASCVTYPPDIYAEKFNSGELGPTHQISSAVHKADLAEVWATVLAVEASPILMDPFGPVSSGCITLRGLLIKAIFREHPLTVHPGTKHAKTSLIRPLFLDGTPVWTTPDYDPMPSDVGNDLLLILVAKERGKSKKMRHMRYKGLMLAKLRTNHSYHKRIGTWEVPVLNEYNDIRANDFFQSSRVGTVRIV